MSIILNTTIISNFAHINQLSILKQLFDKVYISVEVYEEIQSGLDEGYEFYSDIEENIHPFTPQGWIHLISMQDDKELLLFNQFPSTLHRGEASCLAIAHTRNWLFLTDDKAARKAATHLGIQLSGTLGCLVLSVERNLYPLEQANRWLTAIAFQKNILTKIGPIFKIGPIWYPPSQKHYLKDYMRHLGYRSPVTDLAQLLK